LIDGDLSEQVSGRINGRAIIECTSLWFAGGKFGTTWNLKMIEYENTSQAVPTNYVFRNTTPVGSKEEVSFSLTNEKDENENEEDDEIVDSDDN
jgi:hypothetical protein